MGCDARPAALPAALDRGGRFDCALWRCERRCGLQGLLKCLLLEGGDAIVFVWDGGDQPVLTQGEKHSGDTRWMCGVVTLSKYPRVNKHSFLIEMT